MADKSTGNADEFKLAKKLSLIVATDFFCWVPIIVIGFAALGAATIAPQVSAWVALYILPLNSAANPILYTISALDCGKSRTKFRKAAYKQQGPSNIKSETKAESDSTILSRQPNSITKQQSSEMTV